MIQPQLLKGLSHVVVQGGGAEGGGTAGKDDKGVESRAETHSDGVGADLLGVHLLQVGQDILPRYFGVGIVQKTALVLFYLNESTDMMSHLGPGPISSQQS